MSVRFLKKAMWSLGISVVALASQSAGATTFNPHACYQFGCVGFYECGVGPSICPTICQHTSIEVCGGPCLNQAGSWMACF